MKDLLVVTADRTMRKSFHAILSVIHKKSLNIRKINIEQKDILSHSEHDPGVCLRGVELSRSHTTEYKHCLLVFDWEGCGRENNSSIEKEVKRIKDELDKAGWRDRTEVIIIDPELEIWVWSDSSHVSRVLGWTGWDELRDWLIGKNYLKKGEVKPEKPKEALKKVLKIKRKKFSSAIHMEIARKVSYKRCKDPNFYKLIETLKKWFPTSDPLSF